MASIADSPGPRRTRAGRFYAGLLISPVIAAILVSVAAAKYSGGSGSSADPYQIGTAQDLDTLGNTPGDWDEQFVLVKDIDLTGYSEKNFHLIGGWVGFGATENKPFSGMFDGKGRAISNLSFRDTDSGACVGLFRYINVGEVKNLKLANMKITGNGTSTGALVGYLEAGAVVNCHAAGINVTGNTRVGGLVGYVDGAVAQSSTRGQVTGVRYVGGLVGDISEGTVSRSYSKAAVSGDESVGGLAGATVNQASIIDSCYATGKVRGGTGAGGLVGLAAQGRIFRCYSTGAVTGDRNVGGLTGEVMFFGEVIASFWDKETSGQAKSAGGTGKTTAEMRSADTFSNWDFNLTWAPICEGLHTPVFLWQIPLGDLRCPDGVAITDFAWFAMQWERADCGAVNSSCEWADLDESGDVGYRDLAIFAENWLTGID